ncbi:transposase [Micromonospora sp. NBC_01405]|uniref:transposase n=1 Tax=Micromonospora sp. NBC_01405 TaxID=2903589 RepID=UPI003864EE68
MWFVEKYCPDALWHLAQPLLPPHPERHQGGGRSRSDDRATLAAILYVLESGCSRRKLPGSFPVHWRTTHRRFAQWVASPTTTGFGSTATSSTPRATRWRNGRSSYSRRA